MKKQNQRKLGQEYEELAAAWGVEPRGTGKSVWCELS